MKRRIGLSMALTLSLLLLPASFPAPAQGQQTPRRFSAYSGMVTLGTGQVLRVTVAAMGNDGNDWFTLTWKQYMAAGCTGMPAVCRQTVASQGTTTRATLAADEALSFDAPVSGQAVSVTVRSNSPNGKIVFIVFDTSTQRIVATVGADELAPT